MGYETLKLPVGQLLSGYQKIYLKKATITLHPVVVSAFSAKDLIRKSINKIPENYISSPAVIHGYYLSATKEGKKLPGCMNLCSTYTMKILPLTSSIFS